MHKCQNKPESQKLKKVNFYLNGLLPQYDAVIQKQEDSWATPKEFLTIGYGDCEDYALIKYYSLIKLGIDEKKLFLTIVNENFSGGEHMVLTYFRYKNRAPLVLDNLSFKILNLEQRQDLNAQIFINSTGVYKAGKNFSLIKIAQKYKTFEELRKKVLNNH